MEPMIESVTGNPAEWTKEDVTLTINAKDELSGLANEPYSFDGGNTWTSSNTATYAENTEGIVIQVRDNLGNTYTHQTINVTKIDKLEPMIESVTGNPAEWTKEDVTLTINAKDELSGLAAEPYSFDGGKTWISSNVLTYTENVEGIAIQVKDKLGNTYTHETIDITKITKPERMEVTILPTKTQYKAYENFETGEMVITIIYDNGDQEQTTDYTVLNGANLTCLVEKIQIQYNKNTNIKTEISITVSHVEVIDAKIEPTCTEAGLTEGKHCLVCNKVLEVQKTIEALGHTEVIDAKIEPTCTEAGLTEGKHCLVCNEVLEAQETIEALCHNYESQVKQPTCTEQGYTTHQCTKCEDNYIDLYTEPQGHQYENGICTRCGEEEPKVEITSEKYDIDSLYISKIQPRTIIKNFIGQLQTNATEINVYNKDKELQEDTETLATGMTVEFKFNNKLYTYTIVVSGDTNGDGKIKLSDMSMINRHRLKKKALEGEYELAADVTGDGKVNFKDLVKINRFRLNKISEL